MGGLVNNAAEVGSFGLIKDITGSEAAAEAAVDAAKGQERAALAGVEEQRRQFDISTEGLKPFQEAGVSAIGQQQALLGLSGQEAQQQAFSGLEESAGQRFLRDRQEKALLRNASAIGGLGGGNVRTALQQQAAGFAQQDIENQFGRLGQLAGQGQGASTNIAELGSGAATSIANLQGQAAAARASGVLGAQEQRASSTGQLLQLGGAIIGGIYGGPAGAQVGSGVGSAVGGAL